jgi:hypothetical protein
VAACPNLVEADTVSASQESDGSGEPIVPSINKLLTFLFLSGIVSNHPVCAREGGTPCHGRGRGREPPGRSCRRDASDATAHLGNHV